MAGLRASAQNLRGEHPVNATAVGPGACNEGLECGEGLRCVDGECRNVPEETEETLGQWCPVVVNKCPNYSTSWGTVCPSGRRCVTFVNNCSSPVYVAYSVGCNSDGRAGSPQCTCSRGPVLARSQRATWTLVDSQTPVGSCAFMPACLTQALAVVPNYNAWACGTGTRVEFTTGNQQDIYGRFDSYDIDLEKGYSVPMYATPSFTSGCARDATNHNCRPLYCGGPGCPDAYLTSTTGGCTDRSPQVGCQDTFRKQVGFEVTFCPTARSSCQDQKRCP